MNDVSNRRRIAGRFLIGAGVLALPLTASISYADTIAPAAPAAPAAAKFSAAAPLAPPAPPAPPALAHFAMQASSDIEVETEVDEDKVVVVKTVTRDQDGDETSEVRKVKVINSGEPLSEERLEEIMVQVREGLAEADEAIEEAREQHRIAIKMAHGKDGQGLTKIDFECDSVEITQEAEAKPQTIICKSEIFAHALEGLKEARASLAEDGNLDERVKTNVLEAIDEQIRNWEKEAG